MSRLIALALWVEVCLTPVYAATITVATWNMEHLRATNRKDKHNRLSCR